MQKHANKQKCCSCVKNTSKSPLKVKKNIDIEGGILCLCEQYRN